MTAIGQAERVPATTGRWVPSGAALNRGIATGFLTVDRPDPPGRPRVAVGGGRARGLLGRGLLAAAWSSLKLTVIASLIVAAINVVAGTLIAWVLVRDKFPGKALVNSMIDLPFALPTIVAGLTLLALYGPKGPSGSTSPTRRPLSSWRCCS